MATDKSKKSWYVEVVFDGDGGSVGHLVFAPQLVKFIRDSEDKFKVRKDPINSYVIPFVMKNHIVEKLHKKISAVFVHEKERSLNEQNA